MNRKLAHIEGMRGIAICGIVLFHLFPENFPMGYFGVDIFLVICGYFLFRKPFRQADAGLGAACKLFIRKKAERLVVPEAAVVLGALALCFFFLTPEDYGQGAWTALTALAACSNIYLESIKSGYFAADTAYNPFVHTWYLAVTLQVFLLYLAGNAVFCKLPRKWRLVLLALVGVLSFLYCNTHSVNKILECIGWRELPFRTPGYYSTASRLWVVLAGAAVPFMPAVRKRVLSQTIALLALAFLLSIILYPEQLLYRVIPPAAVMCTMCCIRYGAVGWCGRLLSLRGVVRMGTVSFSLYLVHYPLISCYRSLPHLEGAAGVAVLLLCITAATWLFHRYVEKRAFSFKMGCLLWAAAVLGAYACTFSPNAFLWRQSDLRPYNPGVWYRPAGASVRQGYRAGDFTPIHYIEKMQGVGKAGDETLLCMGAEATPSFVLLGDSHGAAVFPAVNDFAGRHHLAGVHVKSYILPFHAWRQDPRNIKGRWDPDKEEALLAWLRVHPELHTVIIAQRWDLRVRDSARCLDGGAAALEESLRCFVQSLKSAGKNVILTSHAPELEDGAVVRNHRFARHYGSAHHLQLLCCPWKDYQEKEGYFHVILSECNDMLQRLEAEGLCHILRIERPLFADGDDLHAVEGDTLIMYDDNHLAPHGALKAIRGCEAELLEWLME